MHNPSPVVALATTQGYLLLIYTVRRCLPEKDKTSGMWPSQVLVTAVFATSLAVCNVLRESSYFLGAAMGRVDFGIGVVGALLLAHGAVSTVLYRGALKIREEDFTYPPPQVLVEVALSFVLCLWAALKVPGAFLPILTDAKENRVTKLPANSDFMIFNHRGKIFLSELVEAKF